MSTIMMHRAEPRVTGTRRWISRRSDLLRLECARQDAARLIRDDLFPPGKCKAAHAIVSAKKLSLARETGGGLSDTAAMIFARPAQAQRIAAWIQGVADSVTEQDATCLLGAIQRGAVADAEEDVVRTEVLAALVEHRLSVGELRSLVDVCDRVLAKTRAVRLSAARELEDLS